MSFRITSNIYLLIQSFNKILYYIIISLFIKIKYIYQKEEDYERRVRETQFEAEA